MEMKWTKEQQKVISLRDRSILVSAAAGSGKTAVLVQRILSKITDKKRPVDIDRMLIMTFTRAAAGEMRERITAAIEKALYENPEDEQLQRQMTLIHTAQITTIDGFCSYVIRNYFHMIGLDPGYRTAEEGELKLLREDVMKELLEDAYREKNEKFLELIECYTSGKTDEGIREMIFRLYEAAMSHPFPEEWLRECLEIYKTDSPQSLRKEHWVELLWKAVEEELNQAERLAEEAAEVCAEPGGPCLYEEALASDIAMIAEAKKKAAERDYDEMVDFMDSISFPRLSAKKQPEVNESKKELVKSLREEEKNILKELSARYFCWKEKSLLKFLSYCRKPMESLAELTMEFCERFSRKKRAQNLLDFMDMEHFALKILVHRDGKEMQPSQAARELSEKYEEILVDEYQDSNYVQEMITTLVSGWILGKKNIFMVGDVKQSIYRFRLARPELFMEKYRRFSLDDSDEQRIDLHKNFRSRPEVLESVNYIFRRIMGEDLGGITYDSSSALYPGAVFPEGGRKEFFRTEVLLVEKDGEELLEEKRGQTDQELEALAIAAEIDKIVGKEEIVDKESGNYRKIEYGDIVILLRSASGWAEPFSQVLASKGIPAYTASRTGYFSASEVVTLLNYLRICDNPLQDIPLTGVLHSSIGGFTAQELALIRSEYPEGLLYESLCAYVKDGQLVLFPQENEGERLKEKIQKFLELLEEIRDMASYTPIHQLILLILKKTGYEEYVRALPGGNQRGANLHMLVEKAMDYEKTSYRGLFNFVRYIENLQKYEVDFGEVNISGAGSGAVQIMTVHKSKGLEFPVVFAAGMGKQFNFQDINARLLLHPDLGFGADAVLPEKRLIIPTLHKQIIRRELKRESLGEELRVLYVALTRAREKLYITGTIGKIEKQMLSIVRFRNREETLLPSGIRSGGRNFWSFILPALAEHSAMNSLFQESGIPVNISDCVDENAEFEIRKITAAGLIQEEIVKLSDGQIQEELLKNWDCEKIYDEEIKNILEERFSFVYPYGYLSEMPVKITVSELKKRSYQSEEENEETLFFEPDVIPLIPRFIEEEKTAYQGAERGTAYHRLMECLDYRHSATLEEIREQIIKLVERKKMSEQEAACIFLKDILDFTDSEIGRRMQKAAFRGELYREQPFVMAVNMKALRPEWDGKDTVLVQGIIDAYFQENGELVLIDYKTDRIHQGQEEKLIGRYRVQLEEYAEALERLMKKRVKESYIYSFALHKTIPVRKREKAH